MATTMIHFNGDRPISIKTPKIVGVEATLSIENSDDNVTFFLRRDQLHQISEAIASLLTQEVR